MEKKNILFIVRRLQMGGIEKATITLANTMATAGHNVHILVLRGSSLLKPDAQVHLHDEVDLERLSRRGILNFFYDLFTRGILRHFIKNSGFFWQGFLVKKELTKKISNLESEFGSFDKIIIRGFGAFEILWNFNDSRCWQVVENVVSNKDKKFSDKFRFSHVFKDKQVICVSNAVAESITKKLDGYDIKAKAIKVIYNAFPIEQISMLAKETIDFNEEYFVHVGRLVPAKNQKLLIEAFRLANLPCKLVIVGDGSERNALEKLVVNLGLSNKIIFVGQQNNPYKWMSKAKAFILSSNIEGFGLVIVESFASGVQVVATNSPKCVYEILIDEQRDLIAEHNPKSLAEKISQAYHHPLTIKSSWVDKFKAEKIIEEYLAL